jgi:hypothetical protein
MPKQALTAFDLTDRGTAEALQLILDYRRSVDAAVAALQRQSGVDDLLVGHRAGRIARRGRLEYPRGLFAFHGVGCRFEIAGRTVDVDFGPDGRHDGFDAWRLGLYAASAFEWQDLSPDRIAAGLAELETSGLIHRPGWEPSTHLYYLSV